MPADLLPPNATALERGLSIAAARVADVPIDLAALWSPDRCPADLLPWLAWSLSTDRWDPDWSDAQKRATVASAIADQRIKGTRLAVENVLASFDELLELVEWWQATPRGDPYTFEVRLPLVDGDGGTGGTRVTADTARAIVAEVTRAKPVRAHFVLVQTLSLVGLAGPAGAARATGYRRLVVPVGDADPAIPWSTLIQDENGEPIEDDFGETIDGSAP